MSPTLLDQNRSRRQYFLNPPVSHCRVAVLVALVAGAAYRLSQYLPGRSFWLDEAALLLNILEKDVWGLMGMLDHAQSSPPLFLWAQRGLALALGPSEWVMRLVPLVAGLVSLVLMAVLAWRVLGPVVAFWAVAWFALCTDLVWHAVSMKQYSGDAMVSAAMLLLAVGWRESLGPVARWGALVALALPATWFSQPAIFMFGGVSLALLPELRRRGRGGMAAWLVGNALVAAAFLLMFHFMREQRVVSLMDFWQGDMADWSHPWIIPWWIVRETYRLCELPYKAFGPIMTVLAALGAFSLWKRDRRLLGLCVLPIAMTVLAGLLRRYPYHGGRVTLFLVPGLLLLCGMGLEWLRQNLSPTLRPWWWVAGLPMVVVGVGEAALYQIKPMGRSHIRPVVQYLRQHRSPAEAIYLLSEGPNPNQPGMGGGLEFRCYWRETDPLIHGTMPEPRLISEPRFWIVFPFLPRHGTRYMEGLLAEIRRYADEDEPARLVVKEGGAAYRFTRRKGQGIGEVPPGR